MGTIIWREMLQQARNPTLWRLRVVVCLAGLGVLFYRAILGSRVGFGNGGEAFFITSATIVACIALMGPALTSDCLASELREGTLGLLRLTPLPLRDVVRGKLIIHGIRLATIAMASLPVLAIPILMGGVSLFNVTVVLCIMAVVGTAGLASGLVASGIFRSAIGSLSLAYGLLGSLALPASLTVGTVVFMMGRGPLRGSPSWQAQVALAVFTGIFCIAMVLIATGIAAQCIGYSWATSVRPQTPKPPGPLLSPPRCLAPWARQVRLRWLERNPLVWLQNRHPIRALGRWAWVALAMLLWVVAVFDSNTMPYFWIDRITVVFMCLSASLAFREERQNGTLEMLLVAPISESQIHRSRVRSLFSQYLPVVLLNFLVWFYLVRSVRDYQMGPGIPSHALGGLLAFPFIGGWMAVKTRSLLAGWMLTFLIGSALPSMLLRIWRVLIEWRVGSSISVALYQAGDPTRDVSHGRFWQDFLFTQLAVMGVQLAMGFVFLLLMKRAIRGTSP